MKINTFTNNRLELQGRVSKVNEYSKGNAANITLAIEAGKDGLGQTKGPIYIQTKSFTPATYSLIKTGMLIRVYGRVAPNNYTNKNGEKIYGIDLIADFVDFLESKSTVENREAVKAAENADETDDMNPIQFY